MNAVERWNLAEEIARLTSEDLGFPLGLAAHMAKRAAREGWLPVRDEQLPAGPKNIGALELTPEQLATIAKLEEIAAREGSLVELCEVEPDGCAVVAEERSAQWDHERTIWSLGEDGELTIW